MKRGLHRSSRTPALADRVDKLVKKLVTHAANDLGSKFCNEYEKRNVLIDTEIDGLRCLIVREPKATTPSISCSPREREIARMVAKGYPNKAIAAVLEISSWTVGTHLRHIFSKLHVSSRAAMVARMIEAGMIQKTTDD
jgi:DNA-binding CsgD family transcriptional regulator